MQSKIDQFINPRILLFVLVLSGVIAISGRGSGMLTGHPIEFDLQTDNYVGTHNFQVDIDCPEIELTNSEFVKISGVGAMTIEDRKGTLRTVYDSVKMARVYKGVDDLYGWRLEIENGNLKKCDIVVTMMDSAFRAVRQIFLENAWPSKWQFPTMDGDSSGPVYEKMEFEVDRAREVAPD